mmetsp:Transcript_65963/g.109629  ORF Transcript_65963/g.109629 Transcript_65963/m.109629 type:complete len:107 (-) Transcript_65963:95-415(-)
MPFLSRSVVNTPSAQYEYSSQHSMPAFCKLHKTIVSSYKERLPKKLTKRIRPAALEDYLASVVRVSHQKELLHPVKTFLGMADPSQPVVPDSLAIVSPGVIVGLPL